jgi:hypothetical protein
MNTTSRLILLAEWSNCMTVEEGARLSADVFVLFAFYIYYVDGSGIVSLSQFALTISSGILSQSIFCRSIPHLTDLYVVPILSFFVAFIMYYKV